MPLLELPSLFFSFLQESGLSVQPIAVLLNGRQIIRAGAAVMIGVPAVKRPEPRIVDDLIEENRVRHGSEDDDVIVCRGIARRTLDRKAGTGCDRLDRGHGADGAAHRLQRENDDGICCHERGGDGDRCHAVYRNIPAGDRQVADGRKKRDARG